MSKQGIEFLERWLADNITPVVKLSIHGDAASMSVEMAENQSRERLGIEAYEGELDCK